MRRAVRDVKKEADGANGRTQSPRSADTEATETPGDILKFALAQEKEAYRLYGKLLDDSRAEVLRDLLTQLRDEELRHVHLIERKIADLNFGRLP